MKYFKKLAIPVFALGFVFVLAQNKAPVSAVSGRASSGGQIIVKFKSSDPIINDSIISRCGGKSRRYFNHIGAEIVQVRPGDETSSVEKFKRFSDVEYVEVDAVGKATSNDSFFANQWAFENSAQTIVGQTGTVDADIDAPEAWAVTTGNGVKVAVLDSGVDQDHEDLSSKLVLQKNFSSAPNVDDIYGHGTHVSGIIAATTDNSTGVAGVCPGCQIMNGKVLTDNGYGYASWAANGIIWAADNGAKVINMSIGFNTQSKTMEKAVNYAWSKGVVLVAAAGNDGNTSKEYPGAFTNVIAVAATDNRDKKASFSTYGSRWVDIAAPGVNVFSTFPNHPFTIQSLYGRSLNYDFGSGTSMASPMVAGVAALVWSTPYGTSNVAVRNRVQQRADAISGTWNYWANGRVNAARAVSP